jgi:hypothetical protein
MSDTGTPDSSHYLEDLSRRWNRAGEECGWKGVVRHPERKIAMTDSPIWRVLGDSEVFDDGLSIDHPPFYLNGGWLLSWDTVEDEELPGPVEGVAARKTGPTRGEKEIADALRRLGPDFARKLMVELEE